MKSNEYNETYKEKIKNAKPGDIIEVPIDYDFCAREKELAYLVVEWWNKAENIEPFMNWIEPEFVNKARELING